MESTSLNLPEIADGEDKSSDFVNCIRNSYRHLRKWAKRTKTNCFRLYDRELYHYPLAIDYYAGRYSVHYFLPSRTSLGPPDELVEEVNKALWTLFRAESKAVYWRNRVRREKLEQYEKADQTKDFFAVLEYGVKFRVNLVDYLDTGLFLDHRETRQLVSSCCKAKRLLNLFSYTASFSVHAALAGACYSKSVDMSNTYTEWARQNFLLNGIDTKNHELVRADCLKFLDEERALYDVIVVDPPTVSRSKKMDQMFDIQEDYIMLLTKTLKRLSPGGTLFFSTNLRTFAFDPTQFSTYEIRNITQKTIPLDFHDPKIHHSWKFTQ